MLSKQLRKVIPFHFQTLIHKQILYFAEKKPPSGFEKFQRKYQKQQSSKVQKEKKQEEAVNPQTIEQETQSTPEEQQQINQKQKEMDEEIKKIQEEIRKIKKGAQAPQTDEQTQEEIERIQEDARKLKEQIQQEQAEKIKRFQQEQQQRKEKQQKDNPQGPGSVNPLLFTLPLLAFYLFTRIEFESSEITMSELIGLLKDKLVKRIEIAKLVDGKQGDNMVARIFSNNGVSTLKIHNIDLFLQIIDDNQSDVAINQMIPVVFQTADSEGFEFSHREWFYVKALLFSLGFGYLIYLYRTGKFKLPNGPNPTDIMGKFKAKQFEQKVKVKFADVAGLDEAKGEIREFVDFLKQPSKYKKLGAKIPRGALLTGPPGTGKTLMAKACAGEAGVPFFYVSGSEFVEMYVGLGASRVRDLFKQAKAKSPSIIFIDEIDAVGKKRNQKGSRNEERDNTLNQLLVEMDGFGTDSHVIVLAATNMKDTLDPALLRPGRFDRSVDITLPDLEGRKAIFMVHLKGIKLDPAKTMEDYAKRLATLTPGFSGAEIANLANEAAIMAARESAAFVSSTHFEMASERVMAGLEKKSNISPEERKVIAYHESGHAVASWFLEGGDPLLKLTIIPRSKGSLGYAQYLPNESHLSTEQQLRDKICAVLGGRLSEEIFFNQVTTGAYDDLKKAYQYAHNIVTKFGMSDSIGYIGYEEGSYQKGYSDATNKLIDDEIAKIILECTIQTRELLNTHKQHVLNLATALLEKESLDLQAIINILGERPFAAKSNYQAYLDLKRVEQL